MKKYSVTIEKPEDLRYHGKNILFDSYLSPGSGFVEYITEYPICRCILKNFKQKSLFVVKKKQVL